MRINQDQPTQKQQTSSVSARPADIEAAVAQICAPSDIARSERGAVSGCRSCPAVTDFHGDSIGDGWSLTNTTVGHFTAANDDNLILGGSGCDFHAANNGGSFVFSLKTGVPRLLNYDQGLITEECRKFADVDSSEFLVCRDWWSGGGAHESHLFLARFSSTGVVKQTYFFETQDTSGTCPDDASPQEEVQDSEIRNVKYATKRPGELIGVTITATQGKITCTQANAEIHAEPDSVGEPPPRKEFPSVKIYEIHFLFDGKKLVVAPESRAAYRIFPKFR